MRAKWRLPSLSCARVHWRQAQPLPPETTPSHRFACHQRFEDQQCSGDAANKQRRSNHVHRYRPRQHSSANGRQPVRPHDDRRRNRPQQPERRLFEQHRNNDGRGLSSGHHNSACVVTSNAGADQASAGTMIHYAARARCARSERRSSAASDANARDDGGPKPIDIGILHQCATCAMPVG